MIIRPEQAGDEPAIRQVVISAFPSAQEADLVEALRTSGCRFLSLVAVAGETVIGHVLMTPVTRKNAPDPAILGLAPLAVLPARQRSGVGSSLMTSAIETARQAGAIAVVLLGNPRYYTRFGFEPAAALGYHTTFDVPHEYFMMHVLDDKAVAREDGGTLHYHPAFDVF